MGQHICSDDTMIRVKKFSVEDNTAYCNGNSLLNITYELDNSTVFDTIASLYSLNLG